MSVKKLLLIFFAIVISYLASAQGALTPTAAPMKNSFSLSGDNIGQLANSVNLFSGDINLPLNVVSIPGREDGGIDVTFLYNSNIQNIVDVWNYESPTGMLGLGWSYEVSRIVVDNKQTGARDDDDYYLIDGGVSIKLVLVANDATSRTYLPKAAKDWIIKFFPSSERWEVTKENGTKIVFGDLNSTRNTLQKVVTWGNWIGNSSSTAGQETQVVVWNLSEVNNIYGDKVFYTYLEETQQVGTGGQQYTQASYVSKIHNNVGSEVQFQYLLKNPEEYPDPSAENGIHQIDAYQERVERLYLSKILLVNNNATPTIYAEVKFNYSTSMLGTAYLTKRLLMSISQIQPSTSKLISATYFEYLTTGAMRGALYKVSNSNGSSATYDYHSGLDIAWSARDKAGNQSIDWKNVWVFDDYFFVLTQGTGSATLSCFAWDGRWRQVINETIASTSLMTGTISCPNVSVSLQKDFFTILNQSNGNFYIYRKSEIVPDQWIKYTGTVTTGSHKMSVHSGDDFVAIRKGDSFLSICIWDGSSWRQEGADLTTASYNTSAFGNVIISQNVTQNPDNIRLYYLDEKKLWNSRSLTTNLNSSANKSWYNSNTFSIGLVDGNENILRWNKTYDLSISDLGFNLNDDSFVYNVAGSSTSIIDRTGNKIRSLRFNGSSWNDTGSMDHQGYDYTSIGNDIFSWMPVVMSDPRKAIFKVYNPNTLSWSSNNEVTFPSTYPSGINVWGGVPNEAGSNFMLINDKFYFRKANGTWTNDANFNYSGLNEVWNGTFVPGYNFITYMTVVGSSARLNLQFFKNGGHGNLEYVSGVGNHYVYKYSTNGLPYDILTSGNTVVTNKGYMYKVLNNNFKGAMKDYPVVRVTINDGGQESNEIHDRYISYLYDAGKAIYDPSGTIVQYNKVTTIPGSSSSSSKPFGYTEIYFFNGLTESELVETFPRETIGVSNVPPTRDIFPTNAASYVKILSGQTYRTKVFDKDNALVSQTYTIWNVDAKDIYAAINGGSLKVDCRYFPKVTKSISYVDGIQTHVEYEYKTSSFQFAAQKSYIRTEYGDRDVNKVEYTYAWEQSNSIGTTLKSANIITPVLQLKNSVGDPAKPNSFSYVGSTVTRWKLWNSPLDASGFPFPVDSYSWKREGTVDFTSWDATTTPPSNWEYAGKVSMRDYGTGLPLEQVSFDDLPSTQLFDDKVLRIVASVNNGSYNHVAYTSFEDNSKGNFTWSDGSVVTDNTSKTGTKYHSLGSTGITKLSLSASETYTLSFWAKTSGGAVVISGVGTVNLGSSSVWTLFKYTITGQTSINIKKSGTTDVKLDELRLYPSKATMNTYTYHPLYGVTSETDINDQTTYTQYDDLGRVSAILDKKKNIIKVFTYNLKK